uniref:Sulfhydryl oxidase n=1 Tax=Anthurium amnicola TaxID=1678845 RepID=A0A1D1XWU7_9ARAE
MSQNPFEAIIKSYESVARCIQTHVSQLFTLNRRVQDHQKQLPEGSSPVPPVSSLHPVTTTERNDFYLLQSMEASLSPAPSVKSKFTVPLTKEELGRATWTLLHTIAAQYPDHPSRQQKRDAKDLSEPRTGWITRGVLAMAMLCAQCS